MAYKLVDPTSPEGQDRFIEVATQEFSYHCGIEIVDTVFIRVKAKEQLYIEILSKEYINNHYPLFAEMMQDAWNTLIRLSGYSDEYFCREYGLYNISHDIGFSTDTFNDMVNGKVKDFITHNPSWTPDLYRLYDDNCSGEIRRRTVIEIVKIKKINLADPKMKPRIMAFAKSSNYDDVTDFLDKYQSLYLVTFELKE